MRAVAQGDCWFLGSQGEEASFLPNAHVTLEVIYIILPAPRVEKCPCWRNKCQSYGGLSPGGILPQGSRFY